MCDHVCGVTNAANACVCSRVFTEAAEGEAVAWMRQLEEEEAISPLWEVFFQLAAYPVPQARTLYPKPDARRAFGGLRASAPPAEGSGLCQPGVTALPTDAGP